MANNEAFEKLANGTGNENGSSCEIIQTGNGIKSGPYTSEWLEKQLQDHNVEIIRKATKRDTVHFYIECINHDQHTAESTDSETVVYIFNGWPVYKCLHQHCQNISFKDFAQITGINYSGKGIEKPPETLLEAYGPGTFVDVNADFNVEIPPKAWAIENIICFGEAAQLAGASKSGKSYLSTDLAICMAGGRLWLNRWQCTRTPVLYLNGENSINDARERFQAVYKAKNITPEHDEQITMICADGALKTIQSITKALENEIVGGKYGLVILDPLYCFYQGSEIDEQDAKQFVSTVKTICRETGSAMVVVHHHSKGGQAMYSNASSRASGSGMLQRAFSTLLDISPIDVSKLDVKLPDGVYPYVFSGQPRQARSFECNLLFDFPLWRQDEDHLLPDRARGKARTAAATKKNPNVQKSKELRSSLPEIIEYCFKTVAQKDDNGDYITAGNIADEYQRRGDDISERSIKRWFEDDIPETSGYKRDDRQGHKRQIRKDSGFHEIADSIDYDNPFIEESDGEAAEIDPNYLPF